MDKKLKKPIIYASSVLIVLLIILIISYGMGLFETSKGNISSTQLEKIETNKNAQNSENIKQDILKANQEKLNIIELIEKTEKELKTNNISFENQIKIFKEQKENNIQQYTRNATENENLMELEGIYNEAKNNLVKKNIEKLTKEKEYNKSRIELKILKKENTKDALEYLLKNKKNELLALEKKDLNSDIKFTSREAEIMAYNEKIKNKGKEIVEKKAEKEEDNKNLNIQNKLLEESKNNFEKLEIEYNKLKTHITQDNTTEPDYTQIKELNNKIKSNLNSEIIRQETGVSTTFDLEE